MQQTKTKPQETLEFKLIKQMQTFSFSPLINLIEEGKWLFVLTSLQAKNYVFNINNGNISFSVTTSGYWITRGGRETISKPKESLELREENDIELHVAEV